jgi:pyruvate,water dikinase
MNYIFSLRRLPKDKAPLAGGKARSLSFMMQNAKLRIPEGHVILCTALEGTKLKDEARTELAELLKGLDAKVTYAVRSSAINEDGENASFAGQYETLTDVRLEDVPKAVEQVAASAGNANVRAYARRQAEGANNQDRAEGVSDLVAQSGDEGRGECEIAIVIQRFVRAKFAGVLFTADAITGRDEKMVGNYVCGAGEKLVSGAENAQEFKINAIRYAYEGPGEFAPYAKMLGKYCRTIRNLYGTPMDVEWAVAGDKVFILQARPVTTLQRLNMDRYEVNGTHSGYKLLTKTNVGEIFMKPVSPMTFSALEKINDVLGLPQWLDNICGQPFMNVSVMCSVAVAFGTKRQKAYESMKGLVGKAPEGVEVPISPFDKKAFLKKILRLFFPKVKSKLTKKQKKEMVEKLADVARDMIKEIRQIPREQAMYQYWEEVMVPKLRDGMASVIGQSGTSMLPLFNTRSQISKIAGEEMADRLCGGCLGMLESMKPLFLISEVIQGKITKEDYVRACGHRCPNEMELMATHPYEDDSYVDRLIEEHRNDNLDMWHMQEMQRKAYEEALAEFKAKYPKKKRWIDKKIARFVQTNVFREELRSKGVWLFCTFREYALQAGRLSGLGDDVFMLTFDELFALLKGDRTAAQSIKARRETYERYLTYAPFPNIVVGRFDPEEWMADPQRRSDAYVSGVQLKVDENADVKGFAGAAGVITGKVHVIIDVERIGDVREGDVLVTRATNVGWTPVFSKVAAIVTDVGAPLSHAAIVARECGIPAVVGCGNATTLLHDGDVVIVDGSAGTVKKIS